jgi:diaminopimelate decarboxylase
MDHFNYRDNILYAEEVPVAAVVREFGTPCFIYSRATLERHFNAYKQALSGIPSLICYAVKANSNLAVINVLARLGAGFDIVSGGELERVLMAGGSPDKIIFSGLGKTVVEIEKALSVGIHCFNVESMAELDRINEIAARLGKQAPISLRVNPDVDAQTHPYISTGLKENKFGIASERAIEVYQKAANMPNLKIIGIDCHIGSQLTELAPYLDTVDRLLEMVDQLSVIGIQLNHLDMGGGLGVNYNQESPPQPKDLAAAISEKIANRGLKLLMEPGRSIAANAGIFVTAVEYIKCTEHKNFAIIDGAMNDLLRPALYGAWQEIIPVLSREGKSRVYDVAGPVCESGDFLGKERPLCIEQGDLLAVRTAGAYGFAMSSNYNSRNRATEIMVDGETGHLVRRRETLEDQIKLETCLPE